MFKKILPFVSIVAMAMSANAADEPAAVSENSENSEISENAAVAVPAEASVPAMPTFSDEKKAEFCKIFGALFVANMGIAEAELSAAEQVAFCEGVAAALKDPEAPKQFTDFIKANEAEFGAYLGSLQQKIQAKAMAAQAAAQEKMIAENSAKGAAYIEKCLEDKDFKKFPSGTLMKVISAGDASVPVKPSSLLTVRYTGTFVDGEIFDSSDRDAQTGEPRHFAPNSEPTAFPCPLSMLIPGWIETLTTLGKGAKVTLVIPPESAYGNDGPLPPASTLVFDIEIVDVQEDKGNAAEAADDEAAIDAVVDEESVPADDAGEESVPAAEK